MIQEHNNGYISPLSILLEFQQEGLLCLSNMGSNHGGYGEGGDIDININE